jgi:hypothetical protein
LSGIIDLSTLLSNMQPELSDLDYVYCTVQSDIASIVKLEPLCTFKEDEGLTLVLEKTVAEANALEFTVTLKKITLKVHSSLEAVGLTAAVASALTQKGVSANVIAGYYHDHIFVPSDKADIALEALLVIGI